MSRLAIILCFIPRVIFGTYTTVRHETYSEHISRQSRSNLPTLRDGYVYRQFDKPGVPSAVGQLTVDPYAVNNQFESRSFRKVRDEPVAYEDLVIPFATPSSLRSEVDYALAKSAANSKYEASKSASGTMLDKLRSLMHYRPPHDMVSENNLVGYDGPSDYRSMDDDDIRTSSRNYDNWPYFYHSPYEYELNKDIFDTQKAKDKRYVADRPENIIPVNEIIENDFPQGYDKTPKHPRDPVDNNPMIGDEPFFSFVLNDYYEKTGDDDSVVFRGLDFRNDFDHEAYLPESHDNRKSLRLGSNYYSTVRPATVNHDAYNKLAGLESSTNRNSNRERVFDKRENDATKNAKHETAFENQANRYNGFKDFFDNFANKFESQDIKKNINYIHEINQDKGENKKGFRRVYHKDEYGEDKEFFDNNKISTKGLEKGGFNAHFGGSEAYLRSQAAAAVGNQSQAASNAGNTSDAKFENSHKGHDRLNTSENKLHRYITVAKEAAQSNNADYENNDYRDHDHK